MKIAIMGAMREEIEPLLQVFENYKTTKHAANTYYEIEYHGIEIVMAYSKIGKVFASITATTLIDHFGCDVVLFTGVAGGINPTLKIGDLIVASRLCQHDVDITAFGHPYGHIPESEVFVETNQELRDLANEVAQEMKLHLLEGIIATGDQFVATQEQKIFIEETFAADAIEMEGAAVAVVCRSFDVPILVLRSISDSADMEAGFDFDAFLKTSAENSAEFMVKFIKKLGDYDATTR